jgi:hypothetical protein
MDATTIYHKTDKGSEEIQSRKYKLAPKQRTILILIDGHTSAGDLDNAAKHMGLGEGYLEKLEHDGFIAAATTTEAKPAQSGPAVQGRAPTAAAKGAPLDENTLFRNAHHFMNDTAVDALGMRSFFFTLKLEKCGTRRELAEMLDDYSKVIAKGSGEEMAAILTNRARALLR